MNIPPISMRIPAMNLPSVGSEAAAPVGGSAGAGAEGFGRALTDAIEGLNETQGAADEASVLMAAGEPIDLHEVMLARETASLHFQLAVQVRNKLIEAYQDVMRMQV